MAPPWGWRCDCRHVLRGPETPSNILTHQKTKTHLRYASAVWDFDVVTFCDHCHDVLHVSQLDNHMTKCASNPNTNAVPPGGAGRAGGHGGGHAGGASGRQGPLSQFSIAAMSGDCVKLGIAKSGTKSALVKRLARFYKGLQSNLQALPQDMQSDPCLIIQTALQLESDG